MVTIKEIAIEANVSTTTVSRALNGHSDVSESTRKRILGIAKDMKYSPNMLARSLVSNKSYTIGLLVSNSGISEGAFKNKFSIEMMFAMEIMSGINGYLSKTNYDLILFSTNSSKQKNKSYTELCMERRVQGVIVSGVKTNDVYLNEIMNSDIPCVLIDIYVTNDNVGLVTTNNYESAIESVEYLIGLGHRNIAMVNGHKYATVSQTRLKGYKEALKQSELPIHDDWILDGAFDERTAYNVTLNLLKQSPEITAIFCASDLMAIGAMKAAQDLGYKVPQRLSIIGFDDIILASYVVPKLTTVFQNKYKMGYSAANMLVNVIEDKENPKRIVLKNELKLGDSTGDCLF